MVVKGAPHYSRRDGEGALEVLPGNEKRRVSISVLVGCARM
jgi:hypothetical protein